MSESVKTVDARGLACPQPVVLTKKALEEGGCDIIEVIVDNPAARENVMRYAGFAHRVIEGVAEEGQGARIRIRAAGRTESAQGASDETAAPPEAETSKAQAAAADAAGTTVFISSPTIGSGDDELGALLMRGFTYALAEAESPPARVILMNGGVTLAVEGSESLQNLKRLAERGVDILACGTCLEFYKLKDKLAVGRVSNMYEIAGRLLEGRTLSV